MDRTARTFELVQLLGRQPRTVAELCRHFGISERTVYRDIDHLQGMGLPLTHGEAGYSILRDDRLRPLMLTTEERALLRTILSNPVLQRSPALARRLETLHAKLENLQREVEETPGAMVLASVDRSGAIGGEQLRVLEEAIAGCHPVGMVYASLSGRKDGWRGLDPYRIFHRGDAWYVIGRCHVHQELRMFRLDRIREIKQHPRTFEPPADFDLDEHLRTSWSVYRGGEQYEVELRFDGSVAPLIRHGRHHPDEEIREDGDGLGYHVRVSHLDEVARWVLGFGGCCQVVAPEELRQRVRDLAEGVLASHASTDSVRSRRPRLRERGGAATRVLEQDRRPPWPDRN